MKKILVIIISLLALGLAWFLLSPLFINQEVNEELPITSKYSPEEAQDIVALEESESEANQVVDIVTPIPENPYQDIIDSGITTEIVESEPTTETIVGVVELVVSEPIIEIIESPEVVDPDPVTSELIPEPEVSITNLGSFVSKNNYSGAGQVKFIQDGGTQTLRFENFSVTNGPDLFVTLNKGDSPKGDHIILEKLKGNKGNQNYDISEYDLDDYNSVSIYCRAFSREFATASLR